MIKSVYRSMTSELSKEAFINYENVNDCMIDLVRHLSSDKFIENQYVCVSDVLLRLKEIKSDMEGLKENLQALMNYS